VATELKNRGPVVSGIVVNGIKECLRELKESANKESVGDICAGRTAGLENSRRVHNPELSGRTVIEEINTTERSGEPLGQSNTVDGIGSVPH
jgi:hypothetical protein